jgi:hypothetical protein
LVANTPRTRKARGRACQQLVRNKFREKYKLEVGLVDEDIESRQMGGTGTDIILSPAAQIAIPFDIEVKCQESLNVWSAFEQAESNTKPGRIPLLCFKRNRTETYAMLKLDDLLRLL